MPVTASDRFSFHSSHLRHEISAPTNSYASSLSAEGQYGSLVLVGAPYLPLRVVQCEQTTVWATHTIMCREEVGQSLQGRVRFVSRVRLQHGNNRDCPSGSFPGRWWGLGIFAVAALTRLADKPVYVLFDPSGGMLGERSTPNSAR
jgi:hypothetical protein